MVTHLSSRTTRRVEVLQYFSVKVVSCPIGLLPDITNSGYKYASSSIADASPLKEMWPRISVTIELPDKVSYIKQ